MNYDEAVLATVTRAQAMRELAAHGVNAAEFFADVGDKQMYTGAEVLDWLGY